jgi:hypothetical protein
MWLAARDSDSCASYQKAWGSASKTTNRASTPALNKARCRFAVPLNNISRSLEISSERGSP